MTSTCHFVNLMKTIFELSLWSFKGGIQILRCEIGGTGWFDFCYATFRSEYLNSYLYEIRCLDVNATTLNSIELPKFELI